MSECVRCLVSGRVQGVFFRAGTQEVAEQLGLKGWVRNLADGRVELEACGGADQLQQLQEWLWQGPPHARISGVVCHPSTGADVGNTFRVRY
ncbi:MAG: acylphosphatase [Granulosicoccaceae bacterium]|jgi:acylphosphatase